MTKTKSKHKKPVRTEVLFHLRDADDLDVYEYSFLMTVETRGRLYTSAKHTWQDMRMKSSKYYDIRKDLEARGLITVERRASHLGTTVIRVNKSAVLALPVRQYGGNGAAASSSKKSATRRGGKPVRRTSVSATPEPKKTDKGKPLKKSIKKKKRVAN